MPAACVNNGGVNSLIRLDSVAEAELPALLAADAVKALNVWHARPGMVVTVVDPLGKMWRGRLTELRADGGVIIPFQSWCRPRESPLQLTVYQALPEKERFELILEKLTELGVTRIVPVVSRRSSTPAARDAIQKKSHRWPEVLRRAAIQCRRAMIPELGSCLELTEAVRTAQDDDLRCILYEGEGTASLKDVLNRRESRSVALLVGPEGGFAPEEVETAKTNNFLPVSLGPRILRTETAAISAVSVIQFALGDLD